MTLNELIEKVNTDNISNDDIVKVLCEIKSELNFVNIGLSFALCTTDTNIIRKNIKDSRKIVGEILNGT